MSQNKAHQIVAEARRSKEEREKGYREQALKLFPWICGRCAREFDHKNLRELTVHHTDHNHDNNPADGSNWELLCLYCHDNEHQRYEEQTRYGSKGGAESKGPQATFSPFADLKSMLQKSK
ncbi:YajD family HNH nuclease [Methylomonas methanica]|uniref:Putative HNH nuclease YajD n=1 Tax=Methylomonas methanica (strain DSM 25384 / MC09) TaxID=857087 RepID=G0A086_METMM|nr:YajD family HNH nuclease [Methylomonas methanica]AEG02392.1 HNH nuclease [Methylomonas methanica MC09]